MMIDIIKKTVLAGIGAVVMSQEKVEGVLEELVDKGKITAEEASEMGDKIVRESKKEFEESKKLLEKYLEDALSKTKIVTINQHTELENRVRKLEARLDGDKTTSKK